MPRPSRRAFFAAAALLMLSAPLALASGDARKALSPPSNLRVSAATASSVSLAWQPSTSRQVAGYDVYRNGTYVAATPNLAYTYGGLACGTTYTFGVQTYNRWGRSGVIEVSSSTSPCSPPP